MRISDWSSDVCSSDLKARDALDRAGWHAARAMEEAYARDPDLVAEASRGRVDSALRAMQREADVRTDPAKRADRFVEGWRELGQQRDAPKRAGDHRGDRKLSEKMAGMAKRHDRDAHMGSVPPPRHP